MRLSEIGEFGLIERIRKMSSRKSTSSLLGIGDDAAVMKLTASRRLLATTDALLEGVHFDLSFTDFYSLGWKSAAVNLSDIAAMGGIPRFCLTSLGIPDYISVEQITDFYRGFNALLRSHSATLVGGDTCVSRGGLFVSVTALGEVESSRIITRAGARPGDSIFVTGSLGGSAAGLEILKSGVTLHSRKHSSTLGAGRSQESGVRRGKANSSRLTPHSSLIKRHLRPVPRVEWGRKIALAGCASAMIDVSDGLSSDLSHICSESGVGAEIAGKQVPLASALRRFSGKIAALEYAFSGGEDYELLFTAPPAKVARIPSLKIVATEIGRIKSGKGIVVIDDRGGKAPVAPSGYDHFHPSKKPRGTSALRPRT